MAMPAAKRQRRSRSLALLILPALVIQFVLAEVPFLVTLWLAFQRWNFQFFPNRQFTGFGNFRTIFGDGTFVPAVVNTFEMVAVSVALVVVIGTLAAKVLNFEFVGRGVARTLVMTPFFIPSAALAYAFNDIIYRPASGLWTYFLGPLGAPTSPTSSHPLMSITLVEIWQWAPLATVIILASMQAIPRDIMEAAQIDGASRLRTFWRVELPLLRRSILVGAAISAIFIFQTFDAVQIMTQGGPGNESMTIAYYIYREVFQNFDVGGGEAAGLVMLLFVIVVGLIGGIAFRVLRSDLNRAQGQRVTEAGE